MVQPKNYLHTVMQSFSICCLITCVWMIFGYSLAFREGTAVIGGASRFWLLGMEVWSIHPLAVTIPESVFMVRPARTHARARTRSHTHTHTHFHTAPIALRAKPRVPPHTCAPTAL
jgi:hypothetical protein